MIFPWEQLYLTKQYILVTEPGVKPIGRWTRGAGTLDISPKIGLATNDDRAIDLSCRACGAGAWALGLDSRSGTFRVFSQPPISMTFGKLPPRQCAERGTSIRPVHEGKHRARARYGPAHGSMYAAP